jgi:hypothetical protein
MEALVIEIITHCYAPGGHEYYADLLKFQFSSLVRFASDVKVKWSVCYQHENDIVRLYLDKFKELSLTLPHGNLVVSPHRMDLPRLLRRAIGRNEVALKSNAGVVWFADADYCFGPGCLKVVEELVTPDMGITVPSHQMISRTHAIGDAMIQEAQGVDLPTIHAKEFGAYKAGRAIGGQQIVGGNVARKGYLNGTRWQAPVDISKSTAFRDTREDRDYRISTRKHTPDGGAVDIPNVWRIRHGSTGLALRRGRTR